MKKIYLIFILVASLFSAESFGQCSTPTTVPYHESFSAIANTNQLPACMAISDPSTCVTFTNTGHTGQTCGGFVYTPAQSSYFYSRAVQLYTGITYSASAWYRTSFNGVTTWTDFSILIGMSQSTTGLVNVASTNGSAENGIYTPLSGTFIVASSGVYYFAVSATSNGVSGSPTLRWDDLDVIIPCLYGNNSPTMTVVQSTFSICRGQTFSASVVGGANSYTWSTGSNSATLIDVPDQDSQYWVVGTNSLTGCTRTVTLPFSLTVKPSPTVAVFASTPSVCLGSSVVLTANGATTYSWSMGASTPSITVTPVVTTVYSVKGTNSNLCSTTTSYTVTVNPLPIVTYSTSVLNNTICRGEVVTFNAGGASDVTYSWITSQGFASSNGVVSFIPPFTTTVSLTGTAVDGCSKTLSYALNVNDCTSITDNSFSGFKIYPNPGHGIYILETGNEDFKSLTVSDFTGKIVLAMQTTTEKIKIDLEKFSSGIYYAMVSSLGETVSIKLIKQ